VDSSAALRLSGAERVGENAIFATDPGKLLFTSHALVNAQEIAKIMADEYRIQVEMATERHILAMTSVADTDEGFRRLKIAVDGVNARFQSCSRELAQAEFSLPEVVFTPRKAVNMPSHEIPWEDAVGRVSAQLVAKYPPGVTLIAPGERILHGLPKQNETIRVIVGTAACRP